MEVCVCVAEPGSASQMRDNEYIVRLMRRAIPLSHEFASKIVGSKDALFLIGGHRSLRTTMEAARQKEAFREVSGIKAYCLEV
jgi:hypothetical protein